MQPIVFKVKTKKLIKQIVLMTGLLLFMIWLLYYVVNASLDSDATLPLLEQALTFFIAPIMIVVTLFVIWHRCVLFSNGTIEISEFGIRSKYLLGPYTELAWSDIVNIREHDMRSRGGQIMITAVISLADSDELFNKLPKWRQWIQFGPLKTVIPTDLFGDQRPELMVTLWRFFERYSPHAGKPNPNAKI